MKLWIRLDAGTPRDPKITELARSLNVRRAEAFGLAASVWCVMAEHAVDGSLADIADEDLEAWAYWQGKRGKFATAFRATFVDPDGTVGGWSERQGALLERMERDRKRHRKPQGNSPEPPRNGGGNSPEPPRSLLGDSTSTVRNGTEQLQTPSAASAAAERPRRVRTLVATPPELLVLDAYKGAHPMSRPGGDDQIRMIRKLLGAGYSSEELIEAIEGNKTDVWAAERGKHELTWIFRNRDNVDRYRAEYQRQHAPAVGENGELSAETLRLVRGA